MKRFFLLFFLLLIILSGCAKTEPVQIVATTLPVYEFTSIICEGTGISVDRLITEDISCLHDYSLQVRQTKLLEAAELVVISGAGLESFLHDILPSDKDIINASGILPEEEHVHHNEHKHDHEDDPHIWLSIPHAKEMCLTIYNGLVSRYPQHEKTFSENLSNVSKRMDALAQYAHSQLSEITHRNIITFHDGFGYLAEAFDLEIVKAIEEESGSEASAKALIEVIGLINRYDVKAIFIETNGSNSAAKIITRETGVPMYRLDMAMSGESWFDAMYNNIDMLKEALK